MLDLVTPQLAELLLRGLRDLTADVIPRAFAVGIALAIGIGATLRLRYRLKAGRPPRPLPATT